MGVEFVVGHKYRNRRGEYELLDIVHGRLKVRYTADGEQADLARDQQERIIDNMQFEDTVQKQVEAAAIAKAAKLPKAKTASARTATVRTASVRKTAVKALPELEAPSLLKLASPLRTEFTKRDLLQASRFFGIIIDEIKK